MKKQTLALSLMAIECLLEQIRPDEVLADELKDAAGELKIALRDHQLIVTPAGCVYSKPSRQQRKLDKIVFKDRRQ